jgi:hypothetical protein
MYLDVRRNRVFVAVLCIVVLCAWCGWVSGFHRSSTSAVVTWPFSLAAVVVVDVLLWRGRYGRRPGIRLEPVRDPWPRPGRGGGLRALEGVSIWLVLTLIVLAWEILGIDTGKHEPHLTISALTQSFRPLNAAMLLVWMLVGIGYGAARARAPSASRSGSRGTGGNGHERSRVEQRGDGSEDPDTLSAVTLAHLPVAAPALLLPASRPAGVAFWLGLVVAAVALDLTARRSNGRLANAEELVRFVTAPMVANVLLVVAWAYAGYHIFAH